LLKYSHNKTDKRPKLLTHLQLIKKCFIEKKKNHSIAKIDVVIGKRKKWQNRKSDLMRKLRRRKCEVKGKSSRRSERAREAKGKVLS
jgi:hypothetical protein